MFVVKLGGSVITNKAKKYFFKQETIDRLAKEIKKANKKLILIHGAGSFGHILAEEYKLNEGYNSDIQIQGFSLTHSKVQELNSLVLNSLHNNGIFAVSIPPHAILKLDDHKPSDIDYKIFDEYLDRGFIPLTFGDIVLDKKISFSICSGDLLAEILANFFKPEKVIFVIDEDGLYTSNPKIDNNAEFIESAELKDLETLSTDLNKYTDVTEGMKGKVNTIKNIAKLGIDVVVLNGNKHNRLHDVLVGKKTRCSIVRGGKQ